MTGETEKHFGHYNYFVVCFVWFSVLILDG